MANLPYAATTANFTQPAPSSTVNVTVTSTVTMVIDQVVFVQNGGYYQVSGITNDTTVVLTNLGLPVNAAASTSVPSGSLVGGFAHDLSGNTVVVGDGVAGTPAGGVVSVQGVSGGTAVPVSGSITVSNLPSSSSPSLYGNFYTSTALAGTFGVTNGSSTVTTSSNQQGILTSGDVVTFASQAASYVISATVESNEFFLSTNYTGTTNSATTGTYTTFASSGVVKSAAGTLFGIRAASGSGTLMFFNSASTPSAGDTPVLIWGTYPVSVGSEFFTTSGLAFSTGIAFGFSSSVFEYLPLSAPAGGQLMVTYA